MPIERCPSPEEIIACLQGRSTRAALDRWENHSENCPRCLDMASRYEDARDALLCDLALLGARSADDDDDQRDRMRALVDRCRFVPSPVPAEVGAGDVEESFESEEEERVPAGFEVGRLLGKGGFGRIHVAFLPAAGLIGALKLPLPRRRNDERALARMRREAKVLARLDHPGIVRLLAAGSDDQEVPYLMMEMLEGESLSALVRRLGPLTTGSVCRIAMRLLDALDHAHSRGILHRDLAPKNVFVEPEGRVVLADWGLAASDDPSALGSEFDLSTSTGEFWGTPAYAAPEQWRDFSRCDERTDLYACGWTLIHLLTAKSPGPPLRSPTAVIETGEERVPLVACRPDLPDALVDALKRLIQAAPADRPSSATEAAELFRSFAEDIPNPSTASREARTRPFASTDSEGPTKRDEALRTLAFVSTALPILRDVMNDAEAPSDLEDWCRAIEEAAEPRSTRPLRVGVLGAAGVGKSELLRALIPELGDLTWQSLRARLVAVEFGERASGTIRRKGDGLESSCPWSEISTAVDGDDGSAFEIEARVPSDFAARGLRFLERRLSLDDLRETARLDRWLRHVDLPLVCLPPDLALSTARLADRRLRDAGHREVHWIVTRIDSVRRTEERRRLMALASASLEHLSTLGRSGILFVSAMTGEAVSVSETESHGFGAMRNRISAYLGPRESELRAFRPLRLVREATRVALALEGQTERLLRLEAEVNMRLAKIEPTVADPGVENRE